MRPSPRLTRRYYAVWPLLLAAVCLAPWAPAAAAELTNDSALHADLLRLLNAERSAAGAPPLHLSTALEQAALEHAQELAAQGALIDERSQAVTQKRLLAAGYDARQWVESLLSMTPPVSAAEVIAVWRQGDTADTYKRLLEPAYTDVGVGIARNARTGETFFSVFFAASQSEAFGHDTAPLQDLTQVRAELLAKINQQRRKAGEPALTRNYHLEVAAQRHAEDMLARSFFAHRNPSGTSVRERSQAAGYDWQAIGENLAEGQRTIDGAIDGWMHSPAHRENILNRQFTESGVGLALGRDPRTGEYRILWVQTFGLPR